MTLKEAKDVLVTRIGWRQDNTVTSFLLSAPNEQTDSGRVFQSEHSAITLANIRDTQPIKSIDATAFNTYLEEIREQVVIQVLSDAFERDYLNEKVLEFYPTCFDDAISLRMVIVASEIITTTTRLNIMERFGKDFVGKLNYDIYRDAPNKFAIRQTNYKHSMGISTRYGFALDSIQRRFGDQKNRIKTITAGQVIGQNEQYGYYNGWDRYRN